MIYILIRPHYEISNIGIIYLNMKSCGFKTLHSNNLLIISFLLTTSHQLKSTRRLCYLHRYGDW